MPEEIETKPEEVIEEQPKVRFLNKIRIHRFKILGGILGILVFAGAVFGAYKLGQRQVQPAPQPIPAPEVVATPTPDPTADWKTYSTTSLLLKYPTAWIVEETTPGFFVFLPDPSFPPNAAPIILDVRSEKTYNQSITDNKKNIIGLEEEVISVAGKPATKISGRLGPGPGEGAFVISVVMDYQGKAVIFGYSDFSGKEEGLYRQTFNLMLSTFKFLD